MSINFNILYPYIPFQGTYIAGTSAATGYEVNNAINGARNEHYKTAAANTATNLDFDFGSDIEPDFWYIARADLLADVESTDVTLQGSADDTFASTTDDTATLSTSNLFGPDGEDFLVYPISWGGAASFRYWRFLIETSGSTVKEFSKINAGLAFNFGVDPIWPRIIRGVNTSPYARRPVQTFSLRFKAVTNAKRNEFMDSIYKYKDINSVFLATNYYHDLLNDKRLMNVFIRDARFTPQVQGLNDLEITFEEAI